jgi:hypothetical protein
MTWGLAECRAQCSLLAVSYFAGGGYEWLGDHRLADIVGRHRDYGVRKFGLHARGWRGNRCLSRYRPGGF